MPNTCAFVDEQRTGAKTLDVHDPEGKAAFAVGVGPEQPLPVGRKAQILFQGGGVGCGGYRFGIAFLNSQLRGLKLIFPLEPGAQFAIGGGDKGRRILPQASKNLHRAGDRLNGDHFQTVVERPSIGQRAVAVKMRFTIKSRMFR